MNAKTQLAGKLLFSHETFDDASKYPTAAQFESTFKATNTLTMAAPSTSFKYYASFGEQLGKGFYYVMVFDQTEDPQKAIQTQYVDANAAVAQATGGWSFDIPTWPPPEKDVQENTVWVKPDHKYRVLIMKPLAEGEFTVPPAPAAVDGAAAAPADAAPAAPTE